MAHIRKRFVESHIREALRFSPLVGVLGMRQVGKTTLAEGILGKSYRTFDDEGQLSAASLSPSEYLKQFETPTVLDECQKVPALFPALKLRVQSCKKPGQFLLTGSVRFTSRKAIRESLTGRIPKIEVMPMTVAEMYQQPLNSPMKWLKWKQPKLQQHFDQRLKWFSNRKIPLFLNHGGMPGICFLRKDGHRKAAFKTLLETILQRDLQLIIQTSVPYSRLLELLRFIAIYQGSRFIEKDASRATGISVPTIGKLLSAFEGLFLIRRFSGSGDRSGDIFYFEDQGIASYLGAESIVSPEQRFTYSQLFSSMHYAEMSQMNMSYFETKGGAHIPFVFQVGDQSIGFILNASESLTASTVKTIKSFQERFRHSSVFALSHSSQVSQVSERAWRIPLAAIA